MENILRVTTRVPKHAKILLVDMQENYFNEFNITNAIKLRIQERLKLMRSKLKQLQEEGHHIYAVVDEKGIHPSLKDISVTILPPWCYGSNNNDSEDPAYRYILHPQIADELSDSIVVVCGLWQELCLYTVTQLLQQKGIVAYLSIDKDISFENAMMWEDDDTITLEDECAAYGVVIQTVE